jgi:hypothetical protein
MRKEGDKLILSWEECHQPWKLVIQEKKNKENNQKNSKDNEKLKK